MANNKQFADAASLGGQPSLTSPVGGSPSSIAGSASETEEQLRKSQAELAEAQRIAQAVMDGARNSHLVYLDCDFNFVRVNEAYARSCGYKPEQMIGKNHFALYPDHENQAIFARVRDTGEAVEFHDKPFVFPDQPERGVTFWDWTLSPVKGGAGKVVGLVLSLFETTARKRAEEALLSERDFSAAVLDTAGALVVVLDTTGRIRRFNRACASLTGYAEEEVLGRPVWFLIPPEERPGVDEEWRALSSGLVRSHHENHWLAKDGRWRRIEWSNTVLTGASGEVVYVIATGLDITERRRAEEAVRERAEELRAVLDAAPVAVWVAQDQECRVITGNAYADELIMGAPRGGNISRSAPPSEAAVTYRVFRDGVELGPEELPAQRATATGKPVPAFDMDLVFPDGRELCLRAGAVPLFDANGGLRGAIAAGLDVTPLKRAQEALRISQERLNQAVAVAGLGTFEHDHDTGATEYSPVLRELMGFGLEEEVTLAAIMEKVVPEDREAVEEAVRRAHDPTGEGIFALEHRLKNADGRARWISVRAQTFFEGEGSARRPIRTVGAGLDITEQKEFQAELRRLVDERTARLQELVGELEHFSYTITHDLKSPLRAMRGFAEIASTFCERPEAKECLGRISTSAERMDRLIADALNYSRTVRQELPLEDVDAGTLLRGMLDSYPEFQPQRAHIQVVGALPVVLANQAGLTQVFSNLLGNAVKFVQSGEMPQIRVWAELAGTSNASKTSGSQPSILNRQPPQWVRIWVEDKGIGIPREMLPRVFDMFARASKDYEGTGIGLALVRKAVQRMGGKVGVETEEGKGSRFWIELKCGEADSCGGEAALSSRVASDSGTVLYVEDEEGDAMFMERAFAKKGLSGKLRVVADGRLAIEYLSGSGKYRNREDYPLPSLVLLDLNLPQVPGFEVLRWMRNNPDYAKTPVVVFSSSTREDDRIKAKHFGADEFVAKPSSGMEFGTVVERLQQRWMGGG